MWFFISKYKRVAKFRLYDMLSFLGSFRLIVVESVRYTLMKKCKSSNVCIIVISLSVQMCVLSSGRNEETDAFQGKVQG